MHDDLLGDVEMVVEGGQFYIIVNGLKIAKRENRQWTNLVPGYSVEDLDGGAKIAIDVDPSMLPQGHTGASGPQPAARNAAFPSTDPDRRIGSERSC